MNVKGKVKVSRMSRNNPGVKGKMKKAVVTLKNGRRHSNGVGKENPKNGYY